MPDFANALDANKAYGQEDHCPGYSDAPSISSVTRAIVVF
jgi:hypothetical protein